ncbi:MAG: PAS domain S-box protein [Planctomycetota bacterium]
MPQDANTPDGPGAAGGPESVHSPPAVDRRAALSRQQALVALGRRAIATPDLSLLMQDAAFLIAEMLGTEYSFVAEVAPGGSKIAHVLVLPGTGSERRRVFIHESGTDGRDSLAGYALEVAHPVAVSELAQEPQFDDCLLNRHGVQSALAVPLALHHRPFGALAACTSRIREFDREDVLFAESAAHLITNTIARIRTETVLAQERRLSINVFETVHAMVLVLDPRGRILRVNRACERVSRFSSDEIEGQPIWNVFPVPQEADSFEAIFGRLGKGASPVECESLLLTKHGDRRRIAWSCSAIPAPDGSTESIIATGIDITAQWQAEEDAAEAKRTVESARSAVRQITGVLFDETPDRSAGMATESSAGTKGEKSDQPSGLLGAGRRRRPRSSFPYRQWIAPFLGEKLPAQSEFGYVECHDVSSGGFSFRASKPPQFDKLVVALGTPPTFTYLIAQVTHVTRVEREGQQMYVVGCTYTGRAEYEGAAE